MNNYVEKRKANFAYFGLGSVFCALFYSFCMYKNPSGVTFPFFIAATLFYICFSLSKLDLTLKRGSGFYIFSMMLLSVSTFCTDDERILWFNKLGIWLLLFSFLLNQFYDTSKWGFGKYCGSIAFTMFGCLGEIASPFTDLADYLSERSGGKKSNALFIIIGVLVACPLLLVVIVLLASADAVFRSVAIKIIAALNPENIFAIAIQIVFMFFLFYLITAFLCDKLIKEETKQTRNGEPVLAITVTSMLSFIYVIFSGIQIVYLFIGNMSLPNGYTYARYAREGFFQLLAVSILNLIIVLVCMSFFKEHKVLKGILTVMSLCTFIMIASSALRMVIYIRYYYLTFLRILVLWGLVLLFVLFVGIMLRIYKDRFPLFRYSMVCVTLLYLFLSFSHPDYWIAKVNMAYTDKQSVEQSDFFLAESPYQDYVYIRNLSADAAPVLISYMEQEGYQYDPANSNLRENWKDVYCSFMERKNQNVGIREFNVSRFVASKYMKRVK